MKKSCFILPILVFIVPSCMSKFTSNILSLQPRELPLVFFWASRTAGKNILSFCLIFLFCFHFFKWHSCWMQNFRLVVFIAFFSTLKCHFIMFWLTLFWLRGRCHLNVTGLFFLFTFKISLSLVFGSLVITCLGMAFFVFICFVSAKFFYI